jgi:hypothetical protein
MSKTPLHDNIIRLFEEREPDLPEMAIEVPRLSQDPGLPRSLDSAVDLTGKPRIIMTFGAGRSGKSTLLRWVVERSQRAGVSDLVLGSVDLRRPTLKQFFPGTMVPGSVSSTGSWLDRLLTRLIEGKMTAAIDFGADESILPLLGEMPDLQQIMADAGVEPVVLYMLTPRVSDLSTLLGMERSGFQPPATAMVLNMGTLMTDNPSKEFDRLRQHSSYKAVIERGAVEAWMPKLVTAKAIEDRCIGFWPAVNEKSLSLLDRSRTARWLEVMEVAFAPIRSWLP